MLLFLKEIHIKNKIISIYYIFAHNLGICLSGLIDTIQSGMLGSINTSPWSRFSGHGKDRKGSMVPYSSTPEMQRAMTLSFALIRIKGGVSCKIILSLVHWTNEGSDQDITLKSTDTGYQEEKKIQVLAYQGQINRRFKGKGGTSGLSTWDFKHGQLSPYFSSSRYTLGKNERTMRKFA